IPGNSTCSCVKNDPKSTLPLNSDSLCVTEKCVQLGRCTVFPIFRFPSTMSGYFLHQCIFIASHYLSNMKKKVDPCTDFYSYACGSYADSRVVPEHSKKVTVLYEMKRALDRHLRGQLTTIGVDGIIKVFVHNSFQDRDTHILMFSPPKLFLEKKKFYRGAPSTNAFLAFYREYIRELFRLLGADVDDDASEIEYQVNDIIDLERRIANLSRSDSLRNHSVISNVMTYGALRERYPEIRWSLFFNEELRSILGPLSDEMLVNVVDVGYFDGLSALVKSKPLRSINNYMMWRLVSTFDMYLASEYRRPSREFHSKILGTTAESPQWENCVREIAENLAMPLSTAYASTYFSAKDKKIAEEMITDLKRSMETLLLDADWMDEKTRNAALKKLESMGHKIGFPDALLNESAVLKPFEVFPAAILQFPMFVPEAPFYVNYAAIGLGIGHEITHGYDDLGAQYDDIGNLKVWWEEDTLATFQKKRQCFINQYSRLVEPITQRNTWCQSLKSSSLNYIMDTDVHSLGMFRVNVPLQNFPAFSKAFKCPIGSPMNPYEKCRIW
ncbi:unnamed protein product, partial [Nippostrongylus brasiliensis]|uniref:Membrane metallo-endopeptidase-like 1 n=1 Tax=Nippostrongylus brasiliensis TaxID=27835 RepID=A0A0N4YH06_NIPBR